MGPLAAQRVNYQRTSQSVRQSVLSEVELVTYMVGGVCVHNQGLASVRADVQLTTYMNTQTDT